MKLEDLVNEYTDPRAPGWLVLDGGQILECAISATRYVAAYSVISSIARSDDALPGAVDTGETQPTYPDPLPALDQPFPVKAPKLIRADTIISVGEWAIIRPLFTLYVERENAMRLEASRAAGLEVYGRSVGEISADIVTEERETIPSKSFCQALVTVE